MPRSSSFAAALAVLLWAVPTLANTVLVPPSLYLVRASRTSIVLEVQAGVTGAPGGFALEWITKADYLAAGWPADYSRVVGAYFMGEPTLNESGLSFRLQPWQSARVELGDVFDETGLYARSTAELSEGTNYVFRVRALAEEGASQSAYSMDHEYATTARSIYDCTVTQGFWKSHPESWSRVATMTLGSVSYTNAQLLAILKMPAKGNGLISLAHQLISTKLNLQLGVVPSAAVQQAVLDADAMIGALVVPPVGSGYLPPGGTAGITETLDQFNNGTIGPGHCPGGDIVPTVNGTWGGLKIRYR